MTYIVIGIIFMFCVEYLSSKEFIKERLPAEINLGWGERCLGIIAWPVWLGVFIYYFLTNLFNR